jgi:hypothetical protein
MNMMTIWTSPTGLPVRPALHRWLGVAALAACVSCRGTVVGDETSGGAATAPSMCGTNHVCFTGTIDGVALQDEVTEGELFATTDLVGGITEGDGVFFFPTSQQEAPPGVGVLRIPSPAPSDPSSSPTSPGQWLCDPLLPSVPQGMDELTLFFLAAPVTLTALRRLGTCPGAPVGGEIVCQGGTGTCDLGDLGGTMTGGVIDGSSPNMTVFSDGGLFLDISAQSGGVLRLPDDHADADALYCVGSVKVAVDGAVTLSGLSRLGTCAEATALGGELTVSEGPIAPAGP